MWSAISNIISGAIKPVTDLIDNMHTSDEEKAKAHKELTKVQNSLISQVMEHEEEQIKAQKEIITAEIKSGWLSRSWRPILMLTIVAIVANNYLIYPYLSMFTEKAVVLDLPSKLWNLMQIGVGGYIAGRSGEKIVDKWKGNKNG